MNRQTTTSARQSSFANSSPPRLQVLSKQVAFSKPPRQSSTGGSERSRPGAVAVCCGIDSLGIVANRSIVPDQKPRSSLQIPPLPRVRSRRAGQRTLQIVLYLPLPRPSRAQQVVTSLPYPGLAGPSTPCASQLVVKQVVAAEAAYRWVALFSLRAFNFL